MRNIMKGRALASALIALFSFSACEDDKPITTGVDVDAVARVEITAANLSMLEVDSTIQLQARAYNAANNVLNTQITWSTNNVMVATISNTGLLRTLDDGTVTITATAGGKSANFQLAVEHKAASVNVASKPAAPLRVAGQFQLDVKILDPHGKVLQRKITYTVRDPEIMAVSATGGLTALKPGTTTVEVTSEGVTSTFEVVVMANVAAISVESPPAVLRVGQTAQVKAVVKDASGNPLTDRPIQWSSSNTGIATVDANGLITAVAPGTVNITVTSETMTAAFTITIASRVGRVAIWPSLMTLDVGGWAPMTATAYDMNGVEVKGEAAVWTSGNSRVFTVDQQGIIRAIGLGNSDVTVTIGGLTATAHVIVPPRVDQLIVKPAALNLYVGGKWAQLQAVAYENGKVVNTPISWVTNAPSIVTVSETGVVAGLKVGTATITVSAGTKTTYVVIHVLAPISTITVPSPLKLWVGTDYQLTPILKDAQGNVLTGRECHYTSSNTWIATVTSTGIIHPKWNGHAHITVECEGLSQVIQVNVDGGGWAR